MIRIIIIVGLFPQSKKIMAVNIARFFIMKYCSAENFVSGLKRDRFMVMGKFRKWLP